jgi:hypothetical protein
MPSNLVGAVFAVAILGGSYLYYAWWNRRSGDRERAALQVQPAQAPVRNLGATAIFFAVCVCGSGLVYWVGRRMEMSEQARHPPVKEQLAALTALAAGSMACPEEELTVLAQEPTLALVKGCHRALTFRWGRRVKGGERHWYQIDPHCTIDYMGCALPCE